MGGRLKMEEGAACRARGEGEEVSNSGACSRQVQGWREEGWDPGQRMADLQKDVDGRAAKHGTSGSLPRDLVPPPQARPGVQCLQPCSLVPTFSARGGRGISRGSLRTVY